MRVVLVHNDSAGSEDHTDAQLVRLLRRAGHEVVAVVSSLERLTAALQENGCDLVAVAGGDGTVGQTASALAGWGVPLAILPLGTANNTARCLGITGKLGNIIASWSRARPKRFDLAFLSDGSVRARYSEACGWGVFPAVIASAKRLAKPDDPKRTLKRDRRVFARTLATHEPAYYSLEVDGRDYSGHYLLVAVANIAMIGPRLEIAPHSDPSDGSLDVIMAGPAHREALVELVAAGRTERALPHVRAKQVALVSADGLHHRDGGLVRHPVGSRRFEIQIEPAAVEYLV